MKSLLCIRRLCLAYALRGCYVAQALCGFLYEDEQNIIKEFEDDCSSQLRKVGVSLNPYGPTRGAILSCIAFIFLTWAVTPDLFYGTTYYFYLSPEDGCLPDPSAVRTIKHSDCSATQGFCRSPKKRRNDRVTVAVWCDGGA